jgi:hypothetical protein
MDPTVLELMKGPQGAEAKDVVAWFKRVHFACASETEGSLALVAEPLGKAIDVLQKLEKAPADQVDKLRAEIGGHMLHAQALTLYCELEELNKLRNAIAAEVAKQKPGTPDRKKGEQLQAAYEKAIDGLARAYNAIRAGKFDELQAVPAIMEQVRKTAQEIAK